MPPRSYQLLKRAALLLFLVAVMLFVASEVVTVAARKVQVRDKDGQVIGEAWIPHDYGTSQLICGSLMVLSGFQFCAILVFGRASYPKRHHRN